MVDLAEMSIRDALVSIPLRKLTIAQSIVSMFGDLAISAVFSVVSFQLHGDVAQVSGIMIAYMLPQAFVGPLAGVFLDRWNVKTSMVVSDLLRAVLVVCLVYSSRIWQFYGVMILLRRDFGFLCARPNHRAPGHSSREWADGGQRPDDAGHADHWQLWRWACGPCD